MQNADTVNIHLLSNSLHLFCFCFSHFKDVRPTENSLKKGVRYIVNFAPEIKEIISETKSLVSLGYSVPQLAQNVALQEHKFIRY